MSVAVPGEPYEGRFYLGDNPVALLLVIGFGSADGSGQAHKGSPHEKKNVFFWALPKLPLPFGTAVEHSNT